MKKSIFAIILIISIFLTSCSNTEEKKIAANLLFSGLYETDNNSKAVSSMIKTLDGQQVKIRGYMARQSPVDNSFLYLVNMPYMACPFCVITDNTMLEVISIYKKDNSPLDFTEKPVEIIGTLEVSEKVDEFNYTTQFRIYADSIKPLVETQEDKLINGYVQQINSLNALTMLQVLFLNLDYALFAPEFTNPERTEDELYEIVLQNYNIEFFSGGIPDIELMVGELKKIKPVDEKIENSHLKILEIYSYELKLVQDIVKVNTKISIGELKIQEILDNYRYLISENKRIYDLFIQWNNTLRE